MCSLNDDMYYAQALLINLSLRIIMAKVMAWVIQETFKLRYLGLVLRLSNHNLTVIDHILFVDFIKKVLDGPEGK